MLQKFFFTCCFTLAITLTQAQDKRDSLNVKLDTIFKDYAHLTSPGCAVSVIKNGKVIATAVYGMANLEYQVPITAESVFDIASVSKQFTGFAISMLIQQGKVSLDDDIHRYLPELPEFGKKITIAHLLYHTSGLRDWPETLHFAGWRWDDPVSYADIMRMVSHQKELNFEPGSQFSYSNTGYNVLAAIVAKVTGQSLPDWETEHIFKPLGMDHTQVPDNNSRLIPGRVVSYFPAGTSFGVSSDLLTAYGSSATYTTIGDLTKWVIHFQQALASGDPVYAWMVKTGRLGNGKEIPYGFGLEVQEHDGIKVISHDGLWSSYRALVINYPQEELSFVLLSNDSRFNPAAYAEQMAQLFLKHSFKTAAPDHGREQATVPVSKAIIKNYTGSFQLAPGWYVTFTEENGKLMVQATGENKFPTEAKSDNVFWVEPYQAYFTFYTNHGRLSDSLLYRKKVAKRVIPRTIDPAGLKAFAGDYYSPELETSYQIKTADGHLLIHHMRLGDFRAEPDLIIKDAFHCDLGTLQFARQHQKVTGFLLSGSRVKNIRFNRR